MEDDGGGVVVGRCDAGRWGFSVQRCRGVVVDTKITIFSTTESQIATL